MTTRKRVIPFFDYCRITRPFRENGRCIARVETTTELTNSLGSTHGGLLMTLLDACMAGAASSSLQEGASVVTIDMQVNFLTPGGGGLTAEGNVLRGGRSLIVCEGKVVDEAGELVAKATGLFRPIMPRLIVLGLFGMCSFVAYWVRLAKIDVDQIAGAFLLMLESGWLDDGKAAKGAWPRGSLSVMRNAVQRNWMARW